MPQSDALTFTRFCALTAQRQDDVGNFARMLLTDRSLPATDADARAYLSRKYGFDNVVERTWSAYKKAKRKQGDARNVRGHH